MFVACYEGGTVVVVAYIYPLVNYSYDTNIDKIETLTLVVSSGSAKKC